MFNLQGSEIIFILLIALVVLGPEKLPGAVRRATKTYAELRKMGDSFQSEFKSVIDEPLREMRETAALVKDQADPKKIAEAAEREAAADAKAAAAAKAMDSASADDGTNEPVAAQPRIDYFAATLTPRPEPARQADDGEAPGPESETDVTAAVQTDGSTSGAPAPVAEFGDAVDHADAVGAGDDNGVQEAS